MTTEVEVQTASYQLERYLKMSALSGLLELRGFRSSEPELTSVQAASILSTQFFDTAHFDYATALELDALIPDTPLAPIETALQVILSTIIRLVRPWWIDLVPLGRERVIDVLSEDQVQCLASAGLTAAEPDAVAVDWWDSMAQIARWQQANANLAAGRTGEQLTIKHEIARLVQLGINKKPRWVAVDSNTAGYDVLSYDQGSIEPVNRLIEVKACAQYPLTFHLTRYEWNTAVQSRDNYVFHIWHLPTETLHELLADDLAPHIPNNQGRGEWESVIVTLPRQRKFGTS